jgi:cobalamin biosynthesis Mg chelatase CobN
LDSKVRLVGAGALGIFLALALMAGLALLGGGERALPAYQLVEETAQTVEVRVVTETVTRTVTLSTTEMKAVKTVTEITTQPTPEAAAPVKGEGEVVEATPTTITTLAQVEAAPLVKPGLPFPAALGVALLVAALGYLWATRRP